MEGLQFGECSVLRGQLHNKKLLKENQLTRAHSTVGLVLICLCSRGEKYSMMYSSATEIRILLCNNTIKMQG